MKINNKCFFDYLFSWRRIYSNCDTWFRVIKVPNETIKYSHRRTEFSGHIMEHPNGEFDEG